jgi:hypothetical protein
MLEVVDDFLELACGLVAFMRCQIGFAARINGSRPGSYSQFVGAEA